MTDYDEIKMKISPGDVVTSKKGFISESSLTGKFYVWHKGEYKGNGLWVCHDKEEVDITVTERVP